MTPNLNYSDGVAQVVALSVYCYNNLATFTTYSGDPSEGAMVKEARNSDEQLIGSVTFIDGRKGTLNCQYTVTADELPGAVNLLRPSYIVSFRGRFYVVGEVKTPIVKNEVIKFSAAVTELQNPFIPLLLTSLGQQKLQTATVISLPRTQSAAAAGTRAGATLAYSLETFATPGAAAPAGITISATTGLITVANTVTVGTYDVRVLVTDTVTLPEGGTNVITGQGRYTITVTP